ncbi:hypothetical protein ACTK3S_001670 [Campylobacter jejuni]
MLFFGVYTLFISILLSILLFNTEVANSLAVEIINRINRFRIIESFLSSKEIGLYILAFIILLQVVFIFWAVYKGFIENEL